MDHVLFSRINFQPLNKGSIPVVQLAEAAKELAVFSE
jgi:hypothetical protein